MSIGIRSCVLESCFCYVGRFCLKIWILLHLLPQRCRHPPLLIGPAKLSKPQRVFRDLLEGALNLLEGALVTLKAGQ